MIGRISFIIVSGLAAAAAIAQYLPKEEASNVGSAQTQTASQAQGETDASAHIGTHDAVVVAMDRVDATQVRALENAAKEADLWTPKPARAVSVMRATPDAAPPLAAQNDGETSESSAFDAVKQMCAEGICAFKAVNAAGIVDFKNGKIIDASDGEKMKTTFAKLRAFAKTPSGSMRHVENNEFLLAFWTCKDASLEECIVVDKVKDVPLPIEFGCNAANQTILTCDNAMPDTISFFEAENCRLNDNRAALAHALAGQAGAAGTFESDGVTYRFSRSATQSGCEVATVMPLDGSGAGIAPDIAPAAALQQSGAPSESKNRFLAIAGGIVFALIGWVCTRRRKDEAQKDDQTQTPAPAAQNDDNPQEIASLRNRLETEKSENERLRSEKTAAQTRVERLEHEVEIQKQEVAQLNEQLEFARTAFKKEQIMRMSLAEEKTRLEDAVASISPCTIVNSPVKCIAGDDSQLGKSSDPKLSESADALNASQRITKNADLSLDEADELDRLGRLSDDDVRSSARPLADANSGKDAAPKDDRRDIFDAISDDGWDEIAESFDAIIMPTKSPAPDAPKDFPAFDLSDESDNAQKQTEEIGIADSIKSSIDLLDADLNEESGFGMTGFLNAIKDEKRHMGSSAGARIDTETRLKPISDLPKLSSIPKISNVGRDARNKMPTSPGGAAAPKSLTAVRARESAEKPKTGTLNGLSPVAKTNAAPSPLERQTPPSSPDLATRKPSDKQEESFKPAPSWSGKSVQDAAPVDNNALYDALKRRAKDVSQMNLPVAPGASGDFEFNRGLSRSGVFSLTGSRVDIDPLSDNACFKQLYEQYVETQKQCGEDTGKFTLEQFVSRLAREKDRLIKNYNCKNVKFSVYIKDGKTSLKATPQK